MIVECDLPKERPVARTPNLWIRTFSAAQTIIVGVRTLAIGVLVRSLNRLPQVGHRYLCWMLWSCILSVPFFTIFSLWQLGHFIGYKPNSVFILATTH